MFQQLLNRFCVNTQAATILALIAAACSINRIFRTLNLGINPQAKPIVSGSTSIPANYSISIPDHCYIRSKDIVLSFELYYCIEKIDN